MSEIFTHGNHILHSDVGSKPVLFLDIDGVLAADNGGPLDVETVERVSTLLRHTGAVAVICSDRARDSTACIAELAAAGLQSFYLRGQCDPSAQGRSLPTTCEDSDPRLSKFSESSKVTRIVEWRRASEARNSLRIIYRRHGCPDLVSRFRA
jgi:hypothetical protein